MMTRSANALTTAALLLAATISGMGKTNAGDCTRHIYNNSTQTWTFSFGLDGPGPFGLDLFDCIYPSGSSFQPNVCRVAPRSTARIYLNGRQVPLSVTIMDALGVARWFGYDVHAVGGDCPFVKHDGNTGAVSVNAPADGDFTVDGDIW